jgi:hypothetical protein
LTAKAVLLVGMNSTVMTGRSTRLGCAGSVRHSGHLRRPRESESRLGTSSGSGMSSGSGTLRCSQTEKD